MRRSIIAPVLAMAVASAWLVPANAQQSQTPTVCKKHDEIANELQMQYQERQVAYGLMGNEAVVEIFASKDGTWTILVTHTSGVACMIAAGESWEQTDLVFGAES